MTRNGNGIDPSYRNRLGTDLLLTLASDPVGEGDVPLEESDGGTYKIYPPVDIGLFTSFKHRTHLHYHAGLPLGSFSQRPPCYLVSPHL